MLVPVEDAGEFERAIPDARKVVLEDTGHVAMIERPATFNRRVMEFLAEQRPLAERPRANRRGLSGRLARERALRPPSRRGARTSPARRLVSRLGGGS